MNKLKTIIIGLCLILIFLLVISCANAVENTDKHNTDNKYSFCGNVCIHLRNHDDMDLKGHLELYDKKGHLVFDETGCGLIEYWGKPFATYTYKCTFLFPYDDVVKTGKIKWYQDSIVIYAD